MRLMTVAVLLFSQGLISAPSLAQTQPSSSPITHSVLAQTKVRLAGNVPLYFRAVGIIVPAKETSSFSAPADGILYEMSGSTVVDIGGKATNLNPHEGGFVAGGKRVVLKAGADIPSTLIHFMLSRAADLDRPEADANATTIEVWRSPKPIPCASGGFGFTGQGSLLDRLGPSPISPNAFVHGT